MLPISTIKEILDDPQPNAIDFLDTIKLNLFANEIFVVTPKGEFKTMPAGCTVLDFAFSVHTFLGTHCIGAKVNHKLVGISHVLESGDQVEILTSKNQKVEKDWIQHVTTAKAKGKIEALLRRMEREKQKIGEDILSDFLQKNEKEATSVNIQKLCRHHALDSREELLSMIGSHTITLGEADLAALSERTYKEKKWKKYLRLFKKKEATDEQAQGEQEAQAQQSTEAASHIDKKKTLVLSEETIGRYSLCEECHPIPGDDVLGYIGDAGRITIHKRQCDIAKRLKATGGNQILAATWDTHGTLSFLATLHIVGFDRVELEPGQSAVVTIPINEKQLAYYDDTTNAWQVEGGTVNVYISASSADDRLTGTITTTAHKLEGNTTDIRRAKADTGKQNTPNAKQVYNIQGVRLDTDINSLPQGLYLVNGTKFIK